ncbi:hypothetical protein M427DRAFT_94179 [Gonapodya prolifera JEL478]|uniref:W2 domain-containing protein n=1 Tax=Gonapodya prolifera (strain JEL478) TaxID=1344416 RepID=A0A139AVE0_GONPJ|nr:hypothetical protein M427DRAFT_94179 [Gonapodya prolifera JEL478]|eukprot:KXS20688.1 hypothetical protein M427DRAFT_94179 [Gonapodya prolifera JEL478]
MSLINIANRDDPFYRYKMPRVVAKIEGRGNGIKTVIPNMTDIAKALARDPVYPTKFFGFELGAQSTIDLKNNKYIVNGAHDAGRLQDVMDKFIEKYVLCGKCGNPETDFIIKRDEIILRCKACGRDSFADKTHKCTSYIVKNPPADAKKGKKDKIAKGGPTPPDSPKPDSGPEDEEAEAGDDDELTRRIHAEASELPEANGSGHGDEDDDWAEDATPEAIAKRQAELGEAVAKLAIGGADDDDEDDSPLAELSAYVRGNPDATDDAIVEHAKELYLKDYKSLTVLPAALLHTATPEDIVKRISAKKALLKKLIRSEKGQKSVLGGFERLFKEVPELMPKVPIVFKWLYDEDLVDEEVFLSWGKKSSKKFVDKNTNKEIRAKAQPFLDWLQQAEEDESDEEDDE